MKVKRINLIIKELEENGVVSVHDLSQKFNVTKMTINRDLKILEDNNIVSRTHGGAIKKGTPMLTELTHLEKKNISIELKKYIAKIASNIVENGDIIFVGASTTNEFLVDNLRDKHIRIITNSYYIFEYIKSEENFETILLGGYLREKSGAFVGEYANLLASQIKIDKCFIGANGIKNNQITNSNQAEATLQKIILEQSNKKYILIDSNKFELKDLYTFYDIANIDAIITDNKLSEEIKKQYEKYVTIMQ